MADVKKFKPVRAKAATQEAAIEQALQMIGATRDEVEIEVLEQSERGVTVRVAPRGSFAQAKPAAPATPATLEATPPEPVAPEATSEGLNTGLNTYESLSTPQNGGDDEADDDNEELTADSITAIAVEDEDADVSLEESATPGPPPTATPETQERVRALAQEFLERMGMTAQVKVASAPSWLASTESDRKENERNVPRLFLQVEGEDVGILIGKHGQTLQSFQYLLNLTLNNQLETSSENGETPTAKSATEGAADGGVHVVVDAGEYRMRRATALERSAREAAARAKRERRSIRMEPMPGHERRLVHLALHDDKDVATASEGREPWRRVIVTPTGTRPSPGGRGRYQERQGERSGGRGYGRSGGFGSGGSTASRSGGSSRGGSSAQGGRLRSGSQGSQGRRGSQGGRGG